MISRSARWAPTARVPRRPRTHDDQHELWRTPGMVAEQGLYAAQDLGHIGPVARLADLGAGSGPFGQRARRAIPGAHQLAIELRGEERRRLTRHYDRVIIGDMFAEVRALRRYAPNLIVANPPFSGALAALALALAVVAIGGHVLFLLRSTFGSSKTAWSFLENTPPVHEFSIAGRVRMRPGTNSKGNPLVGDFVPHTWLLFRRGHRPRRPACVRHFLRPLSDDDLGWTVVPGSERALPEFPIIYRSRNAETV